MDFERILTTHYFLFSSASSPCDIEDMLSFMAFNPQQCYFFICYATVHNTNFSYGNSSYAILSGQSWGRISGHCCIKILTWSFFFHCYAAIYHHCLQNIWRLFHSRRVPWNISLTNQSAMQVQCQIHHCKAPQKVDMFYHPKTLQQYHQALSRISLK